MNETSFAYTRPYARGTNHASMSTLVQVLFVGGPLHGIRTLMADPEFKMELEAATGDVTEYCRRSVESFLGGDPPLQIATYAPTGLPEPEFVRLASDAW